MGVRDEIGRTVNRAYRLANGGRIERVSITHMLIRSGELSFPMVRGYGIGEPAGGEEWLDGFLRRCEFLGLLKEETS